jgi:hypothetical protein
MTEVEGSGDAPPVVSMVRFKARAEVGAVWDIATAALLGMPATAAHRGERDKQELQLNKNG